MIILQIEASSSSSSLCENREELSCQFCMRKFIFRSALERHLMTHTGEKPFLCPYCPHRTNRKYSLNVHLRSKHNIIVERERETSFNIHQEQAEIDSYFNSSQPNV